MSHITSPTKHIFPSVYALQMPTAASLSTRRRPAIDLSQDTLQGHPSRSDSLTSESSTCSTLVDNAGASMPVYLGDEHVMMHLDYMLPISEYPEYDVPPSPSSSLMPDDTLLATPSSSTISLLKAKEALLATPSCSTINLLSESPAPTRQRLWLHRSKRSLSTRNSPPSSPNDSRTQSFLASLLQSRWPKTEPEPPIFGQTAPRAVSPSRGKQRPPSAASMPRSILRTDSHCSPRTIKSPRSLGCVKFAEQPGVWEYNPRRQEEVDDYGEARPHVEWCTRKDSDSDSDSVTTLPPPGERTPHNDSFFKRIMGTSNNNKNTKAVNDRPTISGPMPLAKAASLRQMKEANRSHTELLKEISKGPPTPKKENKLRSLMGRYLKVS